MSRLVLLVMMMVWMSWSAKAFGPGETNVLPPRIAVGIFLGMYAVVIAALRGGATLAVRRTVDGSGNGSGRALFRFGYAMHFARLFIPVWLGVGIYALHWGETVEYLTRFLYRWPSREMHLELPQALLGTFPALFTWMALWWSQFPVDRALREQSVLMNLNDDLPIHAPPGFWQVVAANLRLQVLFTLLPVVVILFVRDLAGAVLGLARVKNPLDVQNVVMIPAAIAVFLFLPVLLRRVVRTERFPDSPLRNRLEAMCRSAGLRYREILLWRTDSSMGNAAVMGVLPQVRYILMSDLLVETMTDSQIEAVFAHELGHVVHKHLMWLGLFALIAILFMAGPGDEILRHAHFWFGRHFTADNWAEIEGLAATVLWATVFISMFGFLHPKFERQADVFAARTMQSYSDTLDDRQNPIKPIAEAASDAPASSVLALPSRTSYVGEYGAGIVASALNRVAVINNIPVAARNWTHGSIAHRMRALYAMSADPSHTSRFDRFMDRLYMGLIASLCTFGAWSIVQQMREDPNQTSQPALKVVSPAPAAHAR